MKIGSFSDSIDNAYVLNAYCIDVEYAIMFGYNFYDDKCDTLGDLRKFENTDLPLVVESESGISDDEVVYWHVVDDSIVFLEQTLEGY